MERLLAFGDAGWGDEILSGTLLTLQLAAVTLPVGMVLGFLSAFLSLSDSRLLRALGWGYSTAMRGMPELLTLFIVYYGGGLLLNAGLNRISAGASFEISPFLAGVVALGLVFGAYAGEVLRGAFQSLSPGQAEAGLAIGMTRRQIFWRIKLPQLWRFALPGLGNLWVNLLKDTSLVSVITLGELMRMSQVAVRTTKEPFFFFLVACAIYWVMCVLSEVILARMEMRANRGIIRARA
jgi:polar amino acid transport system permease protein